MHFHSDVAFLSPDWERTLSSDGMHDRKVKAPTTKSKEVRHVNIVNAGAATTLERQIEIVTNAIRGRQPKEGTTMGYTRWLMCLSLWLCLVTWAAYAGPSHVHAATKDLEERVRQLEQRLEMAEAEKPTKPETFRAYWRDGLNLETADKVFKLRIGGRIQLDGAFIGEDSDVSDVFGSVPSGVEFRRARLSIDGLLYDRFEFKTQYDFADGEPRFKDVYMGVRDIPVVGNFRVGQFKEPFSLEELTSSNYITFMERSLPTIFAPSRNVGLALFSTALDKRMTWAVGAFRAADDFGRSIGDSEFNATLRLTGLPWYEDKGRQLLHLGASYSFSNPADNTVRFRERPEAHISPRYVDTGNFSAKNLNRVGAEAALVYGPLSVQGEYVHAFVNRDSVAGADPQFNGFYGFASYFLTGEHRPYSTSSGTFGRVKPKKNFLNGEGGLGAWEVAARYSQLDLNDEGIDGGKLGDFTFGLNWYLNPNYRVMFNYVFADLKDVGDTHILQMRFQVAF